jgi:hypothetical protein
MLKRSKALAVDSAKLADARSVTFRQPLGYTRMS